MTYASLTTQDAQNLCDAALMNYIMMCQYHLGKRSHATMADMQFFGVVKKLAEENFLKNSSEQELVGDHIPQTQSQSLVSDNPALKAVDEALTQFVAPAKAEEKENVA